MNAAEAREITYQSINNEFFKRMPKIDAMIEKAAQEGKSFITINISGDREGHFIKREYAAKGYYVIFPFTDSQTLTLNW